MNTRLFDIVGNAGASHVYHLHPTQRALAYESGCYVTLWDLEIDKKLMIHPHDCAVTCVQFFGPNYEYLLTIDSGYKPSIFITEWQTMTRIHQMYLPVSKNNQSVVSFQVAYCQKSNLIVIVANYKDHYSFSLWNFKEDSLVLVASNKEETQETCVGVHVFEDSQRTFFAIAEKKMVKYWQCREQRLELLHRIHIKENILDTTVSNLTQFFLFTTEQGRLYIINKEGQFISSIKHPTMNYSTLSLYADYLFLASKDGEIDIYQLSSMKFVKSLKSIANAVKASRNALQKAEKPQERNVYKFKSQEAVESKSLHKLAQISVAKKTGLLALKYTDGNIFIYNMEKDKILHSVSGHSSKINQVCWDRASKKCFVTCSNDGTIRVWNYVGDRWESFAITPSDPAYSSINMSRIEDKSFQSDSEQFNAKGTSYKITCLQVDWASREIFTGDNQGCLNIYDLNQGETKHSIKVGGFKLREISLGTSFIGLAFANESCLVLERQRSFETFIKLEEPRIEMGNKQKASTGIRLLEKDSGVRNDKFHRETPVMFQSKYGGGYRGETSYGSEYRKDANQRVITVHKANSLRLHQVVLNHGYLNSIVLANYQLQGKVIDYTIHVSNDYLLVLTNEDLISIFQVSTGEIKGKIEMPRFSQKLLCDPAGLYIIVASHHMNPDSEYSRGDKSLSAVRNTPNKTFTSPIREKDLTRNINRDQSVLSVFEMWTGEYVGQIHRIPSISALGFSYEGSCLAVGTVKGIVTVLAFDESLRENIYAALEGMQQNPLFWTDFQLTVGEKRLPADVLGDLRQGDKLNVSGFSEKEIHTSFHDNSQADIRSPDLRSQTSQKQKTPIDKMMASQMRSPPSREKTPTMKDYVNEQKIHKGIRSQNLSPTVIMITGDENTRVAARKRESQLSKQGMSNVSTKLIQEKARDQAEQTRAVNFKRMDSDERSESVGWENSGVKMYTENEQQTTPRYQGPIDKVIDLVSEAKEDEGYERYHGNIGGRRIEPDPSDIDDEEEARDPHREEEDEEDDRRIEAFGNQTIQSSGLLEDVSGMYGDMDEFEKRFRRNDDSS